MLIEFYGKECEPCLKMAPLVERLQEETGAKITRYEVWHHKKNAALMEKYDVGSKCGGVPFFINTKTGKMLCGVTAYKKLEAWAVQ